MHARHAFSRQHEALFLPCSLKPFTCTCEWRGSAVEIFMYDDANASRVLWVYQDREIAANMDKKTRARSVMDRVVSLKVCMPIVRARFT